MKIMWQSFRLKIIFKSPPPPMQCNSHVRTYSIGQVYVVIRAFKLLMVLMPKTHEMSCCTKFFFNLIFSPNVWKGALWCLIKQEEINSASYQYIYLLLTLMYMLSLVCTSMLLKTWCWYYLCAPGLSPHPWSISDQLVCCHIRKLILKKLKCKEYTRYRAFHEKIPFLPYIRQKICLFEFKHHCLTGSKNMIQT